MPVQSKYFYWFRRQDRQCACSVLIFVLVQKTEQTRLFYRYKWVWRPCKLGQSHQNVISHYAPNGISLPVWSESIHWFRRESTLKAYSYSYVCIWPWWPRVLGQCHENIIIPFDWPNKYRYTFGWNTSNGSATLTLTGSLPFSKLDRIPTKRLSTVYLSGCQCKGLGLMGGIDTMNTFSHVLPMLWYLNIHIMLILVHANTTCACTSYMMFLK